jgi:hypothetical protein
MFLPSDEGKKDFSAKLASNTETLNNTLKLKNMKLLGFGDKIGINNYHQLGVRFPHVMAFQPFGKGN